MPLTISASLGFGFFFRSPTAPRIIPGVHQPHCSASASRKACCIMQFAVGGCETFNRHDALARYRAYFRDAGTRGHAFDQHRARGALALAAAVFRSREIQIVAE